MRMDNLVGLDSFISVPHQSYCYDFVSEWMHCGETKELYSIARYVEDELRLPNRFSQLTVEDLAGTEMFPCVNEVILTKLMTDISNHIIDADQIKAIAEKRRTCLWYEYVQNFFEGILEVANMQEFYLAHSAGFHTVEAHKVWKEYTEDYCQMDTYYRMFHLAFAKSLNSSNALLDDLFKHDVMTQVPEVKDGKLTYKTVKAKTVVAVGAGEYTNVSTIMTNMEEYAKFSGVKLKEIIKLMHSSIIRLNSSRFFVLVPEIPSSANMPASSHSGFF